MFFSDPPSVGRRLEEPGVAMRICANLIWVQVPTRFKMRLRLMGFLFHGYWPDIVCTFVLVSTYPGLLVAFVFPTAFCFIPIGCLEIARTSEFAVR